MVSEGSHVRKTVCFLRFTRTYILMGGTAIFIFFQESSFHLSGRSNSGGRCPHNDLALRLSLSGVPLGLPLWASLSAFSVSVIHTQQFSNQ